LEPGLGSLRLVIAIAFASLECCCALTSAEEQDSQPISAGQVISAFVMDLPHLI
jgi:hypothetical protein